MIDQLMESMNPDLEQAARRLMRPPEEILRLPDDFYKAMQEYRDLLFVQRQWLRATDRLEREKDLRLRVEIA